MVNSNHILVVCADGLLNSL